MKQKHIAGILAISLGLFGTHRFYLGQRFLGAVYFILFWGGLGITIRTGMPIVMLLPIFISIVDFAVFLAMPKRDFDKRYNRDAFEANESFAGSTVSPVNEDHFFHEYKSAGIEHFRARKFSEATSAFLSALEFRPKDPAICFNLACCYSLLEDSERGLQFLGKALDFGFEDLDKLEAHPALEYLRQQPAFQNLFFPSRNEETTIPTEIASVPTESENPLKEPLLKLEDLKNRGILTAEEFELQRTKMLQAR
jgi:TM2 domain-containing membrane protein YozV